MRILAAISILTLGLASAVAGTPRQNLDIKSQPMRMALRDLGDQMGLQILFRSEDVAKQGITAPQLTGSLTAEQALAKLLVNSGLRYKFLNDKTVLISVKGDEGGKTTAEVNEGAELRLALADVPVMSEREVQSADSRAEDLAGVPEVLVKGQRSINTDIRRTEDDPQPYVVFDREQIARSQAANIGDFLKTRLPMDTTRDSGSQNQNGAGNVTSSINLRGLGTNQTLVLVDGRRMPGTTGTVNNPLQPDLNGIPLVSIERIEILPSTAGGIYGGNATGGVINVVLRHDYRGVEVGVNYANTFDTDSGATRIDLASGFNLGERTQVTIAASRTESNDLTKGDRADFYERAANQLLKRNRSAIMDAGPFFGGGINIQSAEGDLVLDPQYGNTALGAAATYLPFGYAGLQSDSGAVLVRNAGNFNLNMAPLVAAGVSAFTPRVESVSMNLRHQFGGWLEGFIDFSRSNSKATVQTADAPYFAYYLPGDAPNNPFQQAINVANPFDGYTTDIRNESTSTRATGGLIARLPGRWTAALDYGWSRSSQYSTGSNLLGYEVYGVVSTGLPDSRGRPAVDILQENVDLSAYLLSDPFYSTGPYRTDMRDATLRLSGPALSLPGGALNLSFMAERRDEKMRDGFTHELDRDTEVNYTRSFNPHQSQEVTSYYLEGTAPLLSAKNALPWARELELQASVRRDEYTTRSSGRSLIVLQANAPIPVLPYSTAEQSSDNYTLAMRYVPVEGVAFRGSLQTGFLPPSVTQVTSNSRTSTSGFGVTDPKRGRTSIYTGTPWTFITGGNPALQPETSRGWSAGVVLTPHFVPGLRLSADYTSIDKTGEIQGLATQYVLDHEDDFPGRVVRGNRLPADQAGWAGPVTSVDISLVNAAKTQVKAYDFRLDYSMQARGDSEFKWYAIATWQPDLRRQRYASEPIVNSAGYGYSDSMIEWKGNAGVDWTRGPWSLGWNMQYYHSYHPYAANADQATRELFILNLGSDRVASQTYHDLIGGYRFDGARGLLANSEITMGIQNVLNQEPPATFDYGNIGYSGYGDIRLRRYSVAFRKSF